MYKFVSANYGALSGNKFKTTMDQSLDDEANLTDEGKAKIKETFIVILQKEIAKTYKIPNNVSATRHLMIG